MPRTYERNEHFKLGPDEDVWPLFSHLEAVGTKELRSWDGQVDELVAYEDTGGRTSAKSIDEARRDATDRHRGKSLRLSLGDGDSRTLSLAAFYLDDLGIPGFDLIVNVKGPEEAGVIGLFQIVSEELLAFYPPEDEGEAESSAKPDEPAPAEVEPLAEPAPPTEPRRSFWHDPWVLTIGGGVAAR